ncbi:MAG: 50S ribosomal protein L32 [Deltaproteobacteria bacterium]|nr:50S ribosomal protein L32 [Deltaproteobacteria bacterium]
MPVPKRKVSRTRRDKRRTHYKLHPVAGQKCPQCGGARLPHRVCPECGYYKGREVIRPEKAAS